MIFTTSALLLLLYSIDVDVTLLIVEAQVSYDGCRFKRWGLIPPNKILVLLSIDSHIIIFPNVSIRVGRTPKPMHLQLASPLYGHAVVVLLSVRNSQRTCRE